MTSDVSQQLEWKFAHADFTYLFSSISLFHFAFSLHRAVFFFNPAIFASFPIDSCKIPRILIEFVGTRRVTVSFPNSLNSWLEKKDDTRYT